MVSWGTATSMGKESLEEGVTAKKTTVEKKGKTKNIKTRTAGAGRGAERVPKDRGKAREIAQPLLCSGR